MSALFQQFLSVMAAYSVKHHLLPPLVVAGTVFSFLTIPLGILSSQQVINQLRKEPVFYSQLRSTAIPCLGFAAALSLGVGVSSIAMMGNRQSSRKSNKVKHDLFSLQQKLQETEAKLERLKLSESHLKVCGGSVLLSDKVSAEALTLSALKVTNTSASKAYASKVTKIGQGGWESLTGLKTIQNQLQQMQSQIDTLERVVEDSPEVVGEATEGLVCSGVEEYTMVADIKKAA